MSWQKLRLGFMLRILLFIAEAKIEAMANANAHGVDRLDRLARLARLAR